MQAQYNKYICIYLMVKPTVEVSLVSLYLSGTPGGNKEVDVRLLNIEEETPDFRSKDGAGCEEIQSGASRNVQKTA